MNERIRKIAIETDAWCDQHYSDDPMYDIKWEQKFAELIVRECLEQIDKIRDGCEADHEDQQALGADWAGLAVARYFGVE
jgi:hypothetical protein